MTKDVAIRVLEIDASIKELQRTAECCSGEGRLFIRGYVDERVKELHLKKKMIAW
jgi:hypothetical protein